MSAKNISLPKTMAALKDLSASLSACSAVVGEKKINADQKDTVYQNRLSSAQQRIDILMQSSQNAIDNINELAAKIDKVLN